MAKFYFIMTLMILRGFLLPYGSEADLSIEGSGSGESESGEVGSGTDGSGANGSGGDGSEDDESGIESGAASTTPVQFVSTVAPTTSVPTTPTTSVPTTSTTPVQPVSTVAPTTSVPTTPTTSGPTTPTTSVPTTSTTPVQSLSAVAPTTSVPTTTSNSTTPVHSLNITVAPTTSVPTTAPYENNMYPYGPQQNDNEFRLEDSPYFSSYHCLRIDTDWIGFPFFSERHYKLHICRNGIIQLNYEWSWWWPRKFGVYWWLRNMAVIAPFWATTDTFFPFINGHSKVYYQVYSLNTENSTEILDMASKDVKLYGNGTKFANFAATWVLVVTWHKLCPYVYYRYYYYYYYRYYYYGESDVLLNCPWSNTFQAVIITDGFNTFLMYNYPHGGIQWAVPADPEDYRYWSGYYGLPVAGWNAGNDGKDYYNIEASASLAMYNLDTKKGNTDSLARYFWRIEDSDVKGALEKCLAWASLNKQMVISYWFDKLINEDPEMACPCTFWQAWFDWGRFSWTWWYSWPQVCFESRRFKFISSTLKGFIRQECCYSMNWENWGALKLGPPDGGHVKVTMETLSSDEEAYKYCCVDAVRCDLFYLHRPSDSCSRYIPPRRRWFWGDPHIKTLDGGNYTFNGLGEYVMTDAQNGAFQLQARTIPAQGNSTIATIFSAGAAKEENTSTIEVRVKEGGGLDILINKTNYDGYDKLTNQSVEVGGNLSVLKTEENCLQVSFPSTTSVNFCEKKEMLSFVVSLAELYRNTTKGLLGTWNDDPDDDFTLPDGTVLPSSSSLSDIHFKFGVKWQINQSQSLFTYAQNESVYTFKNSDFEPMFADNITWHNDSLREKAEAECGDDHECLFDVASTNDLSVGLVTKDISTQLVNESNTLNNFPPKIITQSNVINATLHKTVELNITAEDNDTITFRVINEPAGAIKNQSGNVLYFRWSIISSQKFNLSFVATDDKGASATWSPTINMCACDNGGQCVPPEEGDKVNTDSKFVYMGCTCQGGYTGRFCDSDIDACESNGQPCYTGVECIDLPPPANSSGYECGPCPSGYNGDGAQCVDIDECQNKSSNDCEQLCVNIPASFFCRCRDGFELNADGRNCDDINECEPSNDCMQKCSNTIGSYNCSCDEFFKPDPTDWRNCLPENPCTSGHGCEHVCFKGGDNQATCTCFANYELESDEKTCRDINECDPANPRHRCSQICENIPGSYKCSCEEGFELNKDGYECEDVNECLDGDLFSCMDKFQMCVNTRGSYKCECEQDLYFIDGKCRGLERNQTAPKPVLPEPRVPSTKEREEAVQFSIPRKSDFEWDFEKDKTFKDKLASVTTDYCTENRTRCALKDARRKRRSPFLDLYTADQVHLLPGYPSNASGSLQVAFYVQQPLGLFIGNISVLPRNTLADVIITHKSALETAIGANITGVDVFFKPDTPTTPPTAGPAEPSNNDWKWVAIGIGVGVLVIILILLIVFWCRAKRKPGPQVKPSPDDVPDEDITLKSLKQSSSKDHAEAYENSSFQT